MRKFLITLIALLGLLGVIHTARNWLESPQVAAVAEADPVELDRLIGVFESRVDIPKPDPLNLSVLGQLYLTRADLGYGIDDYQLARGVLITAVDSMPDTATLNGLARAYLALHQFEEAREAAETSMADEPTQDAIATLVDAELALGGYDKATDLLHRLGLQIPDEPAYLVRRAQLAFLTGDAAMARELSETAVHNAENVGVSVSQQVFYLTVAGRMNFESGRYQPANEFLERALELDARDPGALFVMAKVESALGDIERATDLLELSVNLYPEPSALAFLGDLYMAGGEEASADIQYQTLGALQLLDQAAYRRSVALAQAARGIDPETTLSLAEAELAGRTDPTTWHAYALALYQMGRIDEAYSAIPRILGPADARIWFHAGLIATAAGHSDEAIDYLESALDLNPGFNPLEAPEASRLIEELTS